MTALRPDWIRMRQKLHARFEAVCGLPDASRLASIRGPTARLSEAEVAALWRSAPTQARNHLYLHVPFCKSICSFCNYERLQPSSPDQLAEWLQRVLGSIATLSPATAHLTLHSLYLGGGTPSVLPAPMLDAVLTAIRSGFRWHEDAGRHMELDPQVISASRIEVLRRHGFHHFSFGIQTLDVAINRDHNRGEQDRDAVQRCLTMLRGAGTIHCDFLLGLAGTTPAGILAEVETLLEQGGIDTIDLYEVIPTRDYLASHFGGDRARFEAHMAPFRAGVREPLRALAEQYGCGLRGLGRHSFKLICATPPLGARQRLGYTQLVHIEGRPINLLGLGPSARSRVFGVASLVTLDPGQPGPFRYQGDQGGMTGELQVYLAHVLRDEDTLSLATLASLFGPDASAHLAVPLAAWQALGLAEVGPESVVMAPMDGPQRVRALLWVVQTAHIEDAIARAQGLPLSAMVARAALPAGPWRIASSAGCRLRLERGAESVVLRLAPSLEGDGARWVVERGAAHATETTLRRAVAILRRGLHP